MGHQWLPSSAAIVVVLSVHCFYHPAYRMTQLYTQYEQFTKKKQWRTKWQNSSYRFIIIVPEFPLLSPMQHVWAEWFKLFVLETSHLSVTFALFTPADNILRFCVGNFFLKPNDICVPFVSTDLERFLLSVWPCIFRNNNKIMFLSKRCSIELRLIRIMHFYLSQSKHISEYIKQINHHFAFGCVINI